MIEDALDAEGRAVLSQFGERGMLTDVASLFGGKYGPWNLLTVVIQALAFAGVLYAGRQFLTTDDVAVMLRWGALAALLFAAMSVAKLLHWEEADANRVIREIKRLELQIARSRAV